ncbi:aldo keto reductase [Trichoderma arundinaceum]|uniref:Aldo keto reductase n=1 Tax=Trichoderma arundinaceum TaxID=490622 RepID=A0A395P045_TRIAR|nr:aldo keto reductase [Trichoderma arundinaceum]
MMTDTIIANLPADGLRVVMRSLLVLFPEITHAFECETKKYVEQRVMSSLIGKDTMPSVPDLEKTQQIARSMLGCGLSFESLQLFQNLVSQAAILIPRMNGSRLGELYTFLMSVDGDIVQAMTAVQKSLFIDTGARAMNNGERSLVETLHQSLTSCFSTLKTSKRDYPFGRSLVSTAGILGLPRPALPDAYQDLVDQISLTPSPLQARETFQLNGRKIPRIFSGLWQMSSPAWGAASSSKIVEQFSTHVRQGFTAFDMADHYGDAEIIFGRFSSLYPHRDAIFTATKYCVFHPMVVSREAVQANVTERCRRLQSEKIDLLQFHWQFYENPDYLDALRFLVEDDRVGTVGLCNFDTKHLLKVVESGIKVDTNQVQFSLVDSRPVFEMGSACEKHNIKLLTYGTLCGGFLADKWLGKTEPDIYDGSTTPSQRKYFEMIRSWGGWNLFQELLTALHIIATKHQVAISNVATRWVLDFPYVGAVIVGARMGISEHTDENLSSFGWSLDQSDRDMIEEILMRSRRLEIFQKVGDCGAEYR